MDKIKRDVKSSGGRSVGIVRSLTQGMEVFFVFVFVLDNKITQQVPAFQ
jgi:hypothetical protein